MGRLSKELVAASAEPLILALLARGESYGYAIIREINERGTTILLVEQNAHMALHVVHRGYVIIPV